jgi:hypothetical protein
LEDCGKNTVRDGFIYMYLIREKEWVFFHEAVRMLRFSDGGGCSVFV